MKLLQTAFAATALFLSACSTEDSLGGDWDGRLHLSSNVATLTRATHDLDTKIASGQTVWLYIDKASDASSPLYGKELTTGANGVFTNASDMFFPAGESSINIYAFHINEKSPSISTAAYPGSQLTHKVEQDQQSSGSNYAKSDLLYANTALTKENAKSNSGAIELPFKHSLSKIEVILKKNAEVTATVTKLEILNTQLEATFTPSKSSDELTVAVSGTTAENPIEIDHGITESGGDVLNEAIIIPQTLNDKTEFIRVTLDCGATLVYKLEAQTEFKKGTKYTYTITSKLTGLEVTSKIDDWGNGTGASGDATM